MYDPETDRKPKDKKGREIIKDPRCRVHLIMIEKPSAPNYLPVVRDVNILSPELKNRLVIR
eukprot:Pgem_evm1s1864